MKLPPFLYAAVTVWAAGFPIGCKKPMKKTKNNNSKKTGFKTLPTAVVILRSLYDRKKAAPKNKAEKTSKPPCCQAFGNIGKTPVVKETVAVRGVPNIGPIVA